MTEKALGYFLILIGLIAIAFSSYSVYMVFTGQAPPPALFKFDGVSIPVETLMGGQVPPGVELGEVELLAPDIMNSTTNTLAHLLMMGFFVSVGAKVASLGVNLVRPIIVKMPNTKASTSILDPKDK